MLEELGALALGGAGGIFGLLGGLFKIGVAAWEKKKEQERDIELARINASHEENMAEKRLAEIEAEAKHAAQLAQTTAAKEVDVATLKAIGVAYENDRATFATGEKAKESFLFLLVDFVRGITRPVLTWVLILWGIGFSAWLWMNVPQEVVYSPKFLEMTLYRMIDALIFSMTAAVSFWFVSRQPR